MKFIVFPILIALIACSSLPETKIKRIGITYFPEKTDVFVSKFSETDNLMPIATVKVNINNKVKLLPVVYAYFDPSTDTDKGFPENNDIDHYSFSIDGRGLLTPNIDSTNFIVSELYDTYFQNCISKYNKKRANSKQSADFIDLELTSPEWWQGDETPVSNTGKKSVFICQVAISSAVKDEGMMYVFYNPVDELIDVVIHRN